MLFWIISMMSGLLSIQFLYESLDFTGEKALFFKLEKISAKLHDLQERIQSGLLPNDEEWSNWDKDVVPWSKVITESVTQLRLSGSSIVPTLKRFRESLQRFLHHRRESEAKSAQARAQALVLLFLVPIMSIMLWFSIPGLKERQFYWLVATVISMALPLAGYFWMVSMANAAAWAGLKKEERSWVIAIDASLEYFVAQVKSGQPADMVWPRVYDLVHSICPELAQTWGADLWTQKEVGLFNDRSRQVVYGHEAFSKVCIRLGTSLKKTVQMSLMEGRPCAERCESIQMQFQSEYVTSLRRELDLLPSRALKPLFFCGAPGLFGLLFAGLGFLCIQVMSDLS